MDKKKIAVSTLLLLIIESTWFGAMSRIHSVVSSKLAPLQMELNNKYMIFEKLLSLIDISEWIVAVALLVIYIIYVLSLRRTTE